MTFAEILPFLKEGFAARRECYDRAFIIFRQIPASIDDISIVKSIPPRVKTILAQYGLGIDYEDQYLIYDFSTGIATYCAFDGEDVNASDWYVVPEDYNPYDGE